MAQLLAVVASILTGKVPSQLVVVDLRLRLDTVRDKQSYGIRVWSRILPVVVDLGRDW
jgi:hypothetical protein